MQKPGMQQKALPGFLRVQDSRWKWSYSRAAG